VSAWTRRLLPPLVYAVVTLAIAFPLLSGGYLFFLDHAMGPESAGYYARFLTDNSDPIQNKGGFALALAALDAALPLAWAQKLLLFAPFFLAGLGMHRLSGRLTPLSPGVAYLGGLVYALSPFAYVRGVVGQMGVLWAYALTPWFLAAWFHASETGSRRALATALLLFTATAVFQAHGAFLLALLVALHGGLTVATRKEPLAAVAKRTGLFLGGVLVLNAAWILPVLLARATTLTGISEADQAVFATTAAGLPSVGLAALTLEGFWRGGYATYYATRPALLVVPFLILFLAVRGATPLREDARRLTLVVAALLGFVLAVGTASTLTAPLFHFAWDHVPFFRGFRDAHKLLALVALAYGALAPAGAQALLEGLRRAPAPRLRPLASVTVLALLLAAPVVAATPLLGGYGGQVATTEYPEGWAEAERATAGCDGALLVTPWHMYLDLAWVPNREPRVTNPAKLYFSCPAFTPDNLEVGGIATQSPDPVSRYVSYWLNDRALAHGNPGGIRTFGNLLAPLNVQYVLVLKEADWQPLNAALAAQRDLRLVLENREVALYENTAPRAAWTPDAPVLHVEQWADLQAVSEARPLAGTLLTTDRGLTGTWAVQAPLPGVPVAAWRRDGESPHHQGLGFLAAFPPAGPSTSSLPEPASGLALVGWLISAAGLLVVAAVRVLPRRALARLRLPA